MSYKIIENLKNLFHLAWRQERMPKLTAAEIIKHCGSEFHSMLFYDYTLGQWNANPEAWRDNQSFLWSGQAANLFKKKMESNYRFGRRKIAAVVIKTIAAYKYPGKGHFTDHAPDFPCGCVVANIIAYNPKSKKYESNPSGWFGVEYITTGRFTLTDGFREFVLNMFHSRTLRNTFLRPFEFASLER